LGADFYGSPIAKRRYHEDTKDRKDHKERQILKSNSNKKEDNYKEDNYREWWAASYDQLVPSWSFVSFVFSW